MRFFACGYFHPKNPLGPLIQLLNLFRILGYVQLPRMCGMKLYTFVKHTEWNCLLLQNTHSYVNLLRDLHNAYSHIMGNESCKPSRDTWNEAEIHHVQKSKLCEISEYTKLSKMWSARNVKPKWKNKFGWSGSFLANPLNGQCHQIFHLWFFSSNNFSWSQ
jgi:hypothetical protein